MSTDSTTKRFSQVIEFLSLRTLNTISISPVLNTIVIIFETMSRYSGMWISKGFLMDVGTGINIHKLTGPHFLPLHLFSSKSMVWCGGMVDF